MEMGESDRKNGRVGEQHSEIHINEKKIKKKRIKNSELLSEVTVKIGYKRVIYIVNQDAALVIYIYVCVRYRSRLYIQSKMSIRSE